MKHLNITYRKTNWLELGWWLPQCLFMSTLLLPVAHSQNTDYQGPSLKTADSSKEFAGADILNSNPSFLVGLVLNHDDHHYFGGDLLKMRFQAEEDANLYLLYHQADGTTILLFPNSAIPNPFVLKGRSVSIPQDENEVRFRVQPPYGQEVIQVLACTQTIKHLDQLAVSGSRPSLVSTQILEDILSEFQSKPDSWAEHRIRLQTEQPQSNTQPTPSRNPERFGLFVGIGKYENPELCQTHVELANSARAIHKQMLTNGRIDHDNARLLINEQATKSAIQSEIMEWLLNVSRPGDQVFIYFSGHAGQFDSDDPLEMDGQDEALCPYDFRAGTDDASYEDRIMECRNSAILDNTFARWIQELSGRQIVLILDTCHSAGFVVDQPWQTKSLWAKTFSKTALRTKDIAQMNVIVLAACAADEQSQFEGTSDQTMWFTHCLLKEMGNDTSPRPLSVQSAFELARTRLMELSQQANSDRIQEPLMVDTIILPLPIIP